MSEQPGQRSLRSLPSVDRVLREVGECDVPRPALVAVIRRELDAIRSSMLTAPASDGAMRRIRDAIDDLRRATIQPVINGTGIIIHTNFGRSPLGRSVIDAIAEAGSNYNNLEYDLTGGARGGRAAYLEHNLAVLCEAEAATVVNNCAAALVLILRHLTKEARKNVIASRGELVQIGGGFRVPEILEASGATLREVGTTNKTTLEDYQRAIDDSTAMLLRVHRSNFYMEGFVDSPDVTELARLSKESHIPLVVDLGSGAMFETTTLGGDEREPTPAQTLASGADLVCFSGDKLLGGPQSGIIAGNRQSIDAIKKEPFFRALRCDKLILAGLEATVDLHLQQQTDQIPIFAMMKMTEEVLGTRAQRLVQRLGHLPLGARVGSGRSQVGGGTLPQTEINSVTVDLSPQDRSLEQLARQLRSQQPAVVGYIAEDRFKLDLRTIFEHQEDALVEVVETVVKQQL
ncbi:MAG TPA: L-seryl-tRNA(Sec) selenium transferase [Tepidisphaeraceae bacterium]|jgi:L-seryl-tRNA(Ser) seleniumtransferase